MKQIKIQEINLPDKSSHYIKDKMYNILLGNDHREYFGSEKLAEKFLAETNRFLNIKLHEANYLYYTLFAEFRKCWFFFTANDPQIAKKSRKGHSNGRRLTDHVSQSAPAFDWTGRDRYESLVELASGCENALQDAGSPGMEGERAQSSKDAQRDFPRCFGVGCKGR